MNKRAGIIFVILVYTAMGAACGYVGMTCSRDQRFLGDGAGGGLLTLGLMLFLFSAAFYVQIILHEGGHLVCGFLSGYRFCSFRIGRTLLVRGERGGLVRKTFTVAGTGGQCLMEPPRCSPEEIPCLLYNLGGPAANVAAAVVGGLVYLAFPHIPVLSVFAAFLSVLGLALGLLNFVPMKVGGVANDGYNAAVLRRAPEARRALWIQLAINAEMTKGKRLRDMDPEWFVPSGGAEDSEAQDPLLCAVEHYRCEYLQDRMEFQAAEKACGKLLRSPGLMDQQRFELRCMMLFFELIGPCRREKIDALYTKALKKYIKQTECYVSRRRLTYALELLDKRDERAAEEALEAFEKTAARYPYAGEIETERELIEVIRSCHEQRGMVR